MKQVIFLLNSFIFGLFAQQVAAQQPNPLFKIKSIEISVKNLVKPFNPLPDSIRTYRIAPSLAFNASILHLTEQEVRSAFRMEAYREVTEDADMTLSVQVGNYQVSQSTLQQRTDSLKRNFYWYTEQIMPQVEVVLKDRSGRSIWRENALSVPFSYQTMEYRTEAEARNTFRSRLSDPSYISLVNEACHQTVSNYAETFRGSFDIQSGLVNLYYPSEEISLFLPIVGAIKPLLKKLGNNVSQEAVLAELQPHITDLEKYLANPRPKSKKEWRRYVSAALSLSNVFVSLEQYDKAMQYMRLVIEQEYKECIPLVTELAYRKERYDLYAYYRKTGKHLYEVQRQRTLLLMDSLRKRVYLEGRLVLKNGATVNGTLIDLVQNFKDLKIKVKYEKKLNADVANAEYAISDVKEIYAENWHLAVTEMSSTFYLSEVIAESPSIALCRALEHLSDDRILDSGSVPGGMPKQALYGFKRSRMSPVRKETGELYFLRLGDQEDFSPLSYQSMQNLSVRLDDCPTVARLARYGYYNSHELMKLVADYDSTCGAQIQADAGKTQTEKSRKTNIKPAKSPGFYVGWSTGYNNFTSSLGLHTQIRLKNKLFLRAGAGIGFWGVKYAAGLKYDFRSDLRYRKGWSFAAGYAYSSGLSGLQLGSNTTGSGSTTANQQNAVTVDAHPVGTFHTSFIFNRFFNKKWSFFFETGYAFATQKQPWTVTTPGLKQDAGRKNAKIVQPGGLIFGLGLNRGF